MSSKPRETAKTSLGSWPESKSPHGAPHHVSLETPRGFPAQERKAMRSSPYRMARNRKISVFVVCAARFVSRVLPANPVSLGFSLPVLSGGS